MEGYIQ